MIIVFGQTEGENLSEGFKACLLCPTNNNNNNNNHYNKEDTNKEDDSKLDQCGKLWVS